jgi:hypothetical protein
MPSPVVLKSFPRPHGACRPNSRRATLKSHGGKWLPPELFYRHHYEDVLPQRVWKTLHDDIPPLRKVIETELERGE